MSNFFIVELLSSANNRQKKSGTKPDLRKEVLL